MMVIPPNYGSSYNYLPYQGFFDFLKPDPDKQAQRQADRKKRRGEREDVFTQKQKGALASQGLGIFGDIVKGKILGQGYDAGVDSYPVPAEEPSKVPLIIGGMVLLVGGFLAYKAISK
jgi:hypothetical protein